MNGIVLINKEKDYTSFDVVAKLKKILDFKKIGHCGTLDPMATGVLPIFIGKATKSIPLLLNNDKTYIAQFKLGIKTDTYDITGNVIDKCDLKVKKEDVISLLSNFKGKITQTPPIYSAVKYKGQPLYKYARRGIEVKPKSRTVTIYHLSLLDFDENSQIGTIEVSCSKGTYIRSICNDLGDMLNVYGTMTSLIRTKACGFCLEDCLTLDEFKNKVNNNQNCLLNIDYPFLSLNKIQLNDSQAKLFCNGAPVIFKEPPKYSGKLRVYFNNFLGLGHFEKNILKIDKNFS